MITFFNMFCLGLIMYTLRELYKIKLLFDIFNSNKYFSKILNFLKLNFDT